VLGMTSYATAAVLILGVFCVCMTIQTVAGHIRDVKVAKYTGKDPNLKPPEPYGSGPHGMN
jgi:hypothetical protein